MTELEFFALIEATFAKIEAALEHSDADVDTSINGGILEIEFASGEKMVVNRHTPNLELWLAARSGGFHYRYEQGRWINTRDGTEFYNHFTQLMREHGVDKLVF